MRSYSELLVKVAQLEEENKALHKKTAYLEAKLTRVDSDLKPARHHFGVWMIDLCVSLRVEAGCSYRGIAKALKVIGPHLGQEVKLPSANSIQNWVEKSGLNFLNQTKDKAPYERPALIIDESIGMGPDKLLMVLALDSQKYKPQSLDYKSVRVVHLSARRERKSPAIEKVLDQLNQNWDRQIAYVIGDGEHKLKAASKQVGLNYILDISHFLAGCLKKTFDAAPSYQKFRACLARWRSRGVCQEVISALMPPKQGKKARFMHQSCLVKWFKKMHKHWKNLPLKGQKFYKSLYEHQNIVSNLEQCLEISQKVGQILKEKGLSLASLQYIRQYLIQKEAKSLAFTQKFISILQKKLSIYQKIAQKQAQHCCSDVIESMFGKYKAFASQNPLGIISAACLELPLHTVKKQALKSIIKEGIEAIKLYQLEQWKTENIPQNPIRERRKYFQNFE